MQYFYTAVSFAWRCLYVADCGTISLGSNVFHLIQISFIEVMSFFCRDCWARTCITLELCIGLVYWMLAPFESRSVGYMGSSERQKSRWLFRWFSVGQLLAKLPKWVQLSLGKLQSFQAAADHLNLTSSQPPNTSLSTLNVLALAAAPLYSVQKPAYSVPSLTNLKASLLHAAILHSLILISPHHILSI